MPLDRFVRVATADGAVRFGRVDGDDVVLWSDAPWLAATSGAARETTERVPRARTTTLTPVAPTKILGVGRNYRAHAKELGNEVPVEPLIFYKPPSALLDPGGRVVLPPASVSERIDHEAEIAIVVGRRLRNASPDDALAAVFGATLSCDVTARDLQKKDGQWWRAKGMDSFCPVGPEIVCGVDLARLPISCVVNGELRQNGNTADMIFDVGTVLAHVSRFVTLEPGDVILTGTPEGVGPLRAGDAVEIASEPLGLLRFDVA
jgi:2-keto-4-pentenoate hydratase/2-oxohepta-3-ene-1,7-dioic acid hydratase in catechol pathway